MERSVFSQTSFFMFNLHSHKHTVCKFPRFKKRSFDFTGPTLKYMPQHITSESKIIKGITTHICTLNPINPFHVVSIWTNFELFFMSIDCVANFDHYTKIYFLQVSTTVYVNTRKATNIGFLFQRVRKLNSVLIGSLLFLEIIKTQVIWLSEFILFLSLNAIFVMLHISNVILW